MKAWAVMLCVVTAGGGAWGQSTYVPPADDKAVLAGIEFFAAQNLGALHDRYAECDKTNLCDGKTLKAPLQCSTDPSHNTVILKMPSGALFYDAKLAVDEDGSALSKMRRGTSLPETAFRYPTAPHTSVDAEHVPYIVLPPEFFVAKYADLRTGVKVKVGDIAAVVHAGKVSYALVADTGPVCKVGEGSMKLHEELGHAACREHDANGVCTKGVNSDINAPVLFFVFPDSAKLIGAGLSAGNVNGRLAEQGPKLWEGLKGSH